MCTPTLPPHLGPITPGRHPRPESHRMVAVECAIVCDVNCETWERLGEAAAALRKRLGQETPERPRDFIKQWILHWKEYHDVHDLPRSGRPHKVPFAIAKVCAEEMADGEGGERFSTWADAHRRNPLFGLVEQVCGVKGWELLRRMHVVQPDLMAHDTDPKEPLSEAQKRKRMAIAQEHLSRFPEPAIPGQPSVHNIFFIDETEINVEAAAPPKHQWGLRGTPPAVVPKPPKHAKGTVVKIKYVLAVNSYLGFVGPFFTVGTTGLNEAYPVSQDAYTSTFLFAYPALMLIYVGEYNLKRREGKRVHKEIAAWMDSKDLPRETSL